MYVGIDIFTGNKHEDTAPTGANTAAPVVERREWLLTDINDDDASNSDHAQEAEVQPPIISILDKNRGYLPKVVSRIYLNKCSTRACRQQMPSSLQSGKSPRD